jgi:hypothetical protein
VHAQDLFTALDIGQCHNHLAIEATGTQQGRIENVRTVGGRNQDHPLVRFETIHFHQQLVECLLPFIVATAQAGTPVSTDRVNFVNKDDTGRILLALDKKIAYPRGPDADKHFNEVGAADAEERYSGFPGDGPGQQGFSGPGRSHQQHPLGDPASEAGELFGVLQKLDNFKEFLFGLVDPGHVIESNFSLSIRHQPCATLAE